MRRDVSQTTVLLVLLATVAAAGPLDPLPPEAWSRALAAHLLRRAAFGGTPAEVDEFTRIGVEAAVDRLVNYDQSPYAPPDPALDPAVLAPIDREDVGNGERLELERAAHLEIRCWWIERMIRSPRPFEERMTLFWHGHFTSGAREVKRSLFMLEQNRLLRSAALGSFRELLVGVSRDRAMLVYLDNARNRRKQPNENYARELFELFTLGEGNYTERDVREAARAFTGWSLDRDGFRFYAIAHDSGVKTVLGRTGRLGGEDVIDAILQKPECSEFLARKLLVAFVQPDPPAALVGALAREIRRHEYRLRPVMRTLLLSEAFYSIEARGSLIKSPTDLLVGAARQFSVGAIAYRPFERGLTDLGQELMQPPNVRGWPGGERWINAATLLKRHNAIGTLIHGSGGRAAASPAADGPTSMSMSRTQRTAQAPIDPWPLLPSPPPTDPEAVVDALASQLLAVPLCPERRALLIEHARNHPIVKGERQAGDRLRLLIHLVCSTPEYQLF